MTKDSHDCAALSYADDARYHADRAIHYGRISQVLAWISITLALIIIAVNIYVWVIR